MGKYMTNKATIPIYDYNSNGDWIVVGWKEPIEPDKLAKVNRRAFRPGRRCQKCGNDEMYGAQFTTMANGNICDNCI